MSNLDFSKFFSYWKNPDEVRYVPHLVYSQLDDCEDNENEIANEINGNLVACWQFDTACLGDINRIGVNNGNYIETTTVRVYDGGNDDGDNVLVTSHINSDFHNGSSVELWRKQVSPQKIFEILKELEKTQRKLYSSH